MKEVKLADLSVILAGPIFIMAAFTVNWYYAGICFGIFISRLILYWDQNHVIAYLSDERGFHFHIWKVPEDDEEPAPAPEAEAPPAEAEPALASEQPAPEN